MSEACASPLAPALLARVTQDRWREALGSGCRAGLCSDLDAGLYRNHPALPGVTNARWQHDPETHRQVMSALFETYASLARSLREELQSGDASQAFDQLQCHAAALTSLLGRALAAGEWRVAQAIIEPMEQLWSVRGLAQDADIWIIRAQEALQLAGAGDAPYSTAAGSLALLLTGLHATRELREGHPDVAEQLYEETQRRLDAEPRSSLRSRQLVVGHQQLGLVAQERGHLLEAESSYSNALSLMENLGDMDGVARASQQLGRIAQMQWRLGDATDRYARALQISIDAKNVRGTAAGYHQLGQVAQLEGRWENAEMAFAEALALNVSLGDQGGMLRGYHHLGTVAQDRGEFQRAIEQHTAALVLGERLGNPKAVAGSCHHLGMVAHVRDRLTEAKAWYMEALAINQQLCNHRDLAMTCVTLALLAEEEGHDLDAMEWAIRGLTSIDESLERWGPQLPRLTLRLGFQAFQSCWQSITGNQPPEAVRNFVSSRKDRRRPNLLGWRR